MSARFDCLLDFTTADVFLPGAAWPDFCDPAELQRGVEGAVEQEEKEEELSFLSEIQIINYDTLLFISDLCLPELLLDSVGCIDPAVFAPARDCLEEDLEY